jgi:hypothetical protein
MPQPLNPTEGQFFTLQPVPPPEPKATTHWGLPLALGLLAIPLLMFGFGFSQQQTPATTAASPTVTPSASPLPTPSLAFQQDAITQPPETTAKPPLEPLAVTTTAPVAAPSSDSATLSIAHIQSPGMAANFRAAPSFAQSRLRRLMHGDLVALSPERRVQQDGVVWVPVRWRGQTGWLASNFPWSFKPCPTLKPYHPPHPPNCRLVDQQARPIWCNSKPTAAPPLPHSKRRCASTHPPPLSASPPTVNHSTPCCSASLWYSGLS